MLSSPHVGLIGSRTLLCRVIEWNRHPVRHALLCAGLFLSVTIFWGAVLDQALATLT